MAPRSRAWAQLRQFRTGRRALLSERPADAVTHLRSAVAEAERNSILEAVATRQLAEALLAAGAFADGVAVAARSAEQHESVHAPPRRRLEALTTLGMARSLANAPGALEAYVEASRIAEESNLSRTLVGARLTRLRSRELSAAGEYDGAELLLDSLHWLGASPTRSARREALHVQHEGSIVALRRGKFEKAAAGFHSVAEERAILLGYKHPERLTALHNAAVALRRTSRRRDALDLLQNVGDARAEVLGPDHPDTLVTRSFLALQLAEAGNSERACATASDVLATARNKLGDDHVFTLQIAGRVASVLDKAGRPLDAMAVLEQWAMRARDALGADHPETASLLHEYGNSLRSAGHLAKAYEIFGELADVTWSTKGDAHLDTISTFNSLAVVASDLGLDNVAEAIYRAVLLSLERIGDAQILNQASVRTNLGHLLLGQGRAPEAKRLFEAALVAREAHLEEGNRLLHLSRSNVAAAFAKEGRFENAIAIHRRVHEDRTRLYGPNDPDTISSLHNLASTLAESGRPDEAVPLLSQVVEIRRGLLGESHPNLLASQRALAGALADSDRTEEAENVYREVVQVAERIRAEGTLPDEARRSLFAQYVPAYRALAFIVIARGEAREAFDLIEMIKARTLLERVAGRYLLTEQLASAEELQAYRQAEHRIAELDAVIPTLKDPVRRNSMTVERDKLVAEWRAKERQLRLSPSAYAHASKAESIARPDTESTRDQCVLSYVTHGDRVAAAWLLPNGEVGAADLGRVPGLAATVHACRASLMQPGGVAGLMAADQRGRRAIWSLPNGGIQLGKFGRPPVNGARRMSSDELILERLSSPLLGALPNAVFGTGRLLISPDGPLASLPFEALRRRGSRLVETQDLAYAPSHSFVHAVAPRSRTKRARVPMLAIGAPDFAEHPVQRARGVKQSRLGEARDVSRQGGPGRWSKLPGAAAELSAVARMFDLSNGTTLFQGQSATLADIRRLSESGDLNRAAVILFSTHGLLDPVDPRRNALVLGAQPGDDGLLTAAEFSSYQISADLVVLSACDSGSGLFQIGEGILGLPYAVIVAGARSVLQTLWPIHDVSSAVFMEKFFDLYRKGMPPSRALAEVKRRFAAGLEGPTLAAPSYWAPFLYYGP